ncbi:MAG: DUF4177 domain-containing protein [Actinomycetota bacterium]
MSQPSIPPAPGATLGAGVEHSYKVLTQKDRYFKGKFDPEKLEAALNAYAGEGWKVVGTATADIPSMGRTRQEMVVILERSHG